MAPAFLLAFRSGMARAQKIADIMKDKHPEEPHWYLGIEVCRISPSTCAFTTFFRR
jgi:hypothetical protein